MVGLTPPSGFHPSTRNTYLRRGYVRVPDRITAVSEAYPQLVGVDIFGYLGVDPAVRHRLPFLQRRAVLARSLLHPDWHTGAEQHTGYTSATANDIHEFLTGHTNGPAGNHAVPPMQDCLDAMMWGDPTYHHSNIWNPNAGRKSSMLLQPVPQNERVSGGASGPVASVTVPRRGYNTPVAPPPAPPPAAPMYQTSVISVSSGSDSDSDTPMTGSPSTRRETAMSGRKGSLFEQAKDWNKQRKKTKLRHAKAESESPPLTPTRSTGAATRHGKPVKQEETPTPKSRKRTSSRKPRVYPPGVPPPRMGSRLHGFGNLTFGANKLDGVTIAVVPPYKKKKPVKYIIEGSIDGPTRDGRLNFRVCGKDLGGRDLPSYGARNTSISLEGVLERGGRLVGRFRRFANRPMTDLDDVRNFIRAVIQSMRTRRTDRTREHDIFGGEYSGDSGEEIEEVDEPEDESGEEEEPTFQPPKRKRDPSDDEDEGGAGAGTGVGSTGVGLILGWHDNAASWAMAVV